MIDRHARYRAAELLDSFVEGSITNDQFEEGWPLSADDGALSQISCHLWSQYDDLSEHRLNPNTLDARQIDLFRRTSRFLRSSLEYEWPDLPAFGVPAVFFAVVTLGLSRVFWWRQRQRFRAAGDLSVWPFLRRSDLESVADR